MKSPKKIPVTDSKMIIKHSTEDFTLFFAIKNQIRIHMYDFLKKEIRSTHSNSQNQGKVANGIKEKYST